MDSSSITGKVEFVLGLQHEGVSAKKALTVGAALTSICVGIMAFDGYEDVALEARSRYAEKGLISPQAPFFTYDPYTGLSHIPDAVVRNRAIDAIQAVSEGKKPSRPTYPVL